MSEKMFSFDLGRMMDEAFKLAQQFSEAFGKEMAEGFPHADEWREKFKEKFKVHGGVDCYPYYSYPPLNVYLTREKSLVFEIALAGFEEKDIDLQFRGDYLIFSARAPAVQEEEEGVQYFKRRLKLRDIEEQRYYAPEDKFDRSRVQARFKNGLLRIVVPAREELKEKQGIKVTIVSEDQESRETAGPESTTL